MSHARVWIIGVGPGDPELLTLKAARALRECATLFHAGKTERSGFAIEVVEPLLTESQTVRGMALAMKRGPEDGTIGYDRVAEALVAEARAGRVAGFLTEGDPMLYGSGSYVAEHLARLAPEVSVEIVPGVSAISAAAAKLGWPLVQKAEILTVCPATYHRDEMGRILDRGGSSCWLKAASVLPHLVDELRQRGRLDDAAVVERVGRPDERIFRRVEEAIRPDLSYFTLALVRSERPEIICSTASEAGTLAP